MVLSYYKAANKNILVWCIVIIDMGTSSAIIYTRNVSEAFLRAASTNVCLLIGFNYLTVSITFVKVDFL